MTELANKALPVTEDCYLGLVDEVLHWITQPDVRKDPQAWDLPIQSRDILEGMSLEEDAHLAEKVRVNLHQLRRRVREAGTLLEVRDVDQPLDSASETAALSSAPHTGGKKTRTDCVPYGRVYWACFWA
uniref:Uncharacterized protein n=1 Tax=Paramormyrops kingsleyae TaxID=1676925 RepID=A0A3B3TCC6_9TELE